ncbi:MAG: DUF2264 domain-containing protein [Thermomicrobiales bacterium]
MTMSGPFTRDDAETLWARLVAGWADHLDRTGARLVIDGIPNQHDASGSYEGVTRMLWGIGGWLSQPERSPVIHWRGRHDDLEALARAAILAGTDLASPGYWGHSADGRRDQRTVESGQVAWFLWITRDRIWDHLSEAARNRIAAWLERVAPPPEREWPSNWALFWVLNHAVRSELGLSHDRSLIEDVTGPYLDRVWCGGGWYDDGPRAGTNHFDDYNLWVFASHVLLWADLDTKATPSRVALLSSRVREQMEHVPWFFAADGSYPEYGRSLAYKFARLGAMLWAYRRGAWPHGPGMLRRLVGRHIRWYLDRGAIRADGTLRQELTATGSSAIREPYISTGATYWAMQAFGGLWCLPDDDPFWTAEEEPLPVERQDFVRVFPEPGWLLAGDRRTGIVHRFSAKSQHDDPAKYGKFHASTAAPITVGLTDGHPVPDAMLCLTDGEMYGHRDAIDAGTVGEPGWLRTHYRQRSGGREHTIETVIVVSGNLHLRAHRIDIAPGTSPIAAIEGAGAFGFDPGERPVMDRDTSRSISMARMGDRAVAIRAVIGYDGAAIPFAYSGVGATHAEVVVPTLRASLDEGVSGLACLVSLGDAEDLRRMRMCEPMVSWRDDGAVTVSGFLDEPIHIPPIPAQPFDRS